MEKTVNANLLTPVDFQLVFSLDKALIYTYLALISQKTISYTLTCQKNENIEFSTQIKITIKQRKSHMNTVSKFSAVLFCLKPEIRLNIQGLVVQSILA